MYVGGQGEAANAWKPSGYVSDLEGERGWKVLDLLGRRRILSTPWIAYQLVSNQLDGATERIIEVLECEWRRLGEEGERRRGDVSMDPECKFFLGF